MFLNNTPTGLVERCRMKVKLYLKKYHDSKLIIYKKNSGQKNQCCVYICAECWTFVSHF